MAVFFTEIYRNIILLASVFPVLIFDAEIF